MNELLARLAAARPAAGVPVTWRVPGRLACFVNQSSPSFTDGDAERTHGVAHALVEQGLSVVAFTCSGPPWEPRGSGGKAPASQHVVEGVRYVPLRLPADAARAVPCLAESLKELLRVFKPSAVMAASPAESALPAAIAARELGLPFFYEVRDARHFAPGSAQDRADTRMELAVARAAERVFALDASMRDALARCGLDAGRIELLPQAPGAWRQATAALSSLLRSPASQAARRMAPATTSLEELCLGSGADASIELDELPVWCEMDLTEQDYVKLFADVSYANIPATQRRKALLLVKFLDRGGKPLPGPYKGFTPSDQNGWFRYLAPALDPGEPLCVLQPPAGTARVQLGFRSFYTAGDERVSMGRRVRLRWHANHPPTPAIEPVTRARPALPCLPFETAPRREPRRLRVASILDPFSHACFAPECELIPITPAAWREQLFDRKIDMVLVESAWHGNDDSWLYRIASFAKPPGNELSDVLGWARKAGVPTVFWNKEDPPNFDRFIDRAAEFDHVFTTDENCIERYRKRVGTGTRVAALPFAAQPRIHNPLLDQPRLDATSFAGTYYADDFEPRRRAMDMLLRVASRHGLDIFDRMFNVAGKEKQRFEFPPDLRPFIRGSLPYEEMLKAYRRYRVALNVNSVSDSPTMFSRRVFELLACGTPVVSTESLGIDAIFKGVVPTVETEAEAAAEFERLMTSGHAWLRRSVQGLRTVYASHTYAHRVAEIAAAVGLGGLPAPCRDVAVAVHPQGDALRFAQAMAQQGERPREVVVAGVLAGQPAARQHLEALLGAGLQATVLPVDNIASYMRQRHPGAVVAVCDSRHHYGPGYLLDARISVTGTPGLDASTMRPAKDVVASLQDRSFDAAARVGMLSQLACCGSVAAAAESPMLSEALLKHGDGHFEGLSRALRTRACFDFLAHVGPAGVAHPSIVDL